MEEQNARKSTKPRPLAPLQSTSSGKGSTRATPTFGLNGLSGGLMSRYSEKRAIQVEDENDRSKVKGILNERRLSEMQWGGNE